jgi:hypothetical protein
LPFQIGQTNFRVQNAGGDILFDARTSRVVAFEERFHVTGLVAVSALGTSTAVTIDEAQVFQVRVLDRSPLAP